MTDRSQLLCLYKAYCAAGSSMRSWLGSLAHGQSGPMLLPSSLKLCPLLGPGSPCHSAHLFLNHTSLKATFLHISSAGWTITPQHHLYIEWGHVLFRCLCQTCHLHVFSMSFAFIDLKLVRGESNHHTLPHARNNFCD